MKLASNNGRKTIRISKKEWISIGQNVGWLEKSAQVEDAVLEANPQEASPVTGSPKDGNIAVKKLQCKNCKYKGPRSEFVDDSGYLKGCPTCGNRYTRVVV